MISLLKLRKRLIILNVRQRGRKSLTKFQLVFVNLRLILQSVSLLYSICKEMSIVTEKIYNLQNQISVSEEINSPVFRPFVLYVLESHHPHVTKQRFEQLISDN